MPGTVRTATTGPIAIGNRDNGLLADGVTFWSIVEDNGVLYLYTSTDRVTWTLRNTITLTHPLTSTGYWSSCIATSNEIMVAYCPAVATFGAYVTRLTYAAGPVWTQQAEESVIGLTGASGTGGTYSQVGAIDCCYAAGVVPFVTFMCGDSLNNLEERNRVKRTSDNTWQECYATNGGGRGQGIPNGLYALSGKLLSVSVCSENITAVPGSNLVYIAKAIKDASNSGSSGNNDYIDVMQVNVNTAANGISPGYGLLNWWGISNSGFYTAFSNTTARTHAVFSPAAGIFDLVAWQGSTSVTMRLWRFYVSGSNASSNNINTPINNVAQTAVSQDSIANNSATVANTARAGFMYLVPTDTGDTAPAGTAPAIIGVTFTYTSGGYVNTRMNAAKVWGTYAGSASGSFLYTQYLSNFWRVPPSSNVHPWADDGARNQYSMASLVRPSAAGARWVAGMTYNATSKAYLYQENVITAAPTNYAPANGGTISTDQPTITAQATRGTTVDWQQPVKIEYQLAKDSGFTTSLKDIVLADVYPGVPSASNYLKPSAGSYASWPYAIDPANALSQTTWYMRVRPWDMFDNYGPWSATTSFVNSHPPTAVPQSPSGDVTLDYGASGVVAMVWQYSDASPNSTQTAYEIVVERNSDGTVVLDTGKLTLAGAQGTNLTANVTIPAAYKDAELRWKISVWDNENIQGPYSAYSLFYVSDKPTASVTSPTAAQVINTAQPTIQWTFTASGGRTQRSYRVVITDTTANAVAYDSGVVNSSATSHTLPTPILHNTGNYSVQVTVTGSAGLSNTSAAVAFTTSWTPPAAPAYTLDASLYDSNGYVKITWTNASQDATFSSYRVYRRLTGQTLATLVYETFSATAAYEFDDWLAGANQSYDYAVVQVADRFGSLIESAYNWTTVTPVGTDYWLIGTDIATNAAAVKMRLPIVTADSFTEEYESATLQIIGRGRKVDYGTRWGYTGTMTAQFRDDTTSTARQKRQTLENVKSQKIALYLRTPFGDIWQVNVDNIGIARVAGVGAREFVDATIPYAEIS